MTRQINHSEQGVDICTHEAFHWSLSPCNEDGWTCFHCGKLGFRPDFDRKHTNIKVDGILLELHEAKFEYISNGSMGDIITANVCKRCHEENRFTQADIIRFIMEDPNIVPGDFWQKEAAKFLAAESET